MKYALTEKDIVYAGGNKPVELSLKQLYCKCGHILFGMNVLGLYYYECNNCEFLIEGREAELLYMAFINDLV